MSDVTKTGYTSLADATGGGTMAAVVEALPAVVTERVEVIAPANLPGNYELHCDFQGCPVVVRVPPEGVKQGQQFLADVIRSGGGGVVDPGVRGHNIPIGHWRDDLCSCFSHGLCHPMLWLACCFQPLALGQIMTRMGLSATGNVIPPERVRQQKWSAFKVMACLFILYLAVNQAISVLVTPYIDSMNYTYEFDDAGGVTSTPPDYSSVPLWVWIILGMQKALKFLFVVYMLVMLARTRAYVRDRYRIPEQSCKGCEDGCCAFWCACCTTLQIARHTADYNTYTAACCSETGLPPSAPEVV